MSICWEACDAALQRPCYWGWLECPPSRRLYNRGASQLYDDFVKWASFHSSEFRLKLTLLPHSEYQTEALQGDRYSLSDSVYARTGLILLYSEICSDSRSYSQYTVTLYHKHQYLFVVFESWQSNFDAERSAKRRNVICKNGSLGP